MVKVITYGTFDLLHFGHLRLLERARALGDYLIVGVTTEDFDKKRGKINVKQSLMERVQAVRATGLADEIIVEEYLGQKIDDIKRLGIDVFTVGSDWDGYFDYLKEYCQVVYLPRTQGVSSSDIRSANDELRLGLVGDVPMVQKTMEEAAYVNGIRLSALLSANRDIIARAQDIKLACVHEFEEILECSDAVYIATRQQHREALARQALERGKHVLCEAPVCFSLDSYRNLKRLARKLNLVFLDEIKTAYATAFHRLKLLVKSGCIGKIASVEATCSRLLLESDYRDFSAEDLKNSEAGRIDYAQNENFLPYGSMAEWAPIALLPALQILGTNYKECSFVTQWTCKEKLIDGFTKMELLYDDALASIKLGNTVKSEGELIIAGSKAYIYVPAPWWKTDYFELRFENPAHNKRYFYQLDGEGIRFELVNFLKAIRADEGNIYLDDEVTETIVKIMEAFASKKYTKTIG